MADDIANVVQAEAKKAGLSAKDARKAVKRIKSGKVMSQIAPQLQQTFMGMAPQTPKEKLRAKLREHASRRQSAASKERDYQQMKERVYKEREEETKRKEQAKKTAANRKKNHKKKLREMEAKLGTISHDLYNVCLERQKANEYKDEGSKNRDRNIIELYCKQQEFTEKLDMDELDDI